MRSNRIVLAMLACTLLTGVLRAGVLRIGPAFAQAAADPVIAKVNGAEIRLSDVTEAAQNLPQEYRNMPQNVLIPLVTDQLVDRAAVAAMARRDGLDKDPATARAIVRAADETLENAKMRKDIEPTLTDENLRARYAREIGRAHV